MAQHVDIDAKDNVFQIFINIDGVNKIYKTQTLSISNNDSVETVITKIQNKLNLPSYFTYKLKFGMRFLKPSKHINEYNINDGSTLIAVASPTSMASLENSQLIDRINGISRSINKMIWENKDRLLICRSLNELQSTIKSLSTQKIKQSQAAKLRIYRQIYSNNEQKIKRETKIKQTTQTEITKIDTLNIEINNKIYELQKVKERNLQKRDILTLELNGIKQRYNNLNKELKETEESMKVIEKRMKSYNYGDVIQSKLKEYEKHFNEWTKYDVVSWIKLIENRKFNDNKYLSLFSQIERFGICGTSLSLLNNPLCLEMIGLSENEREILLRNIERTIYIQNDEQKSDICTICAGKRINCVFVPCGHQTICFQCYQRSKQQFQKCPICRNRVSQTVKTFMNGF